MALWLRKGAEMGHVGLISPLYTTCVISGKSIVARFKAHKAVNVKAPIDFQALWIRAFGPDFQVLGVHDQSQILRKAQLSFRHLNKGEFSGVLSFQTLPLGHWRLDFQTSFQQHPKY